MAGKRHRKPARRTKKSLTQKTHPIPPPRVEPDKTKYDRQREKERVRRELEEADE
jgi:hypothetical protein